MSSNDDETIDENNTTNYIPIVCDNTETIVYSVEVQKAIDEVHLYYILNI